VVVVVVVGVMHNAWKRKIKEQQEAAAVLR